ncbi:MAG: hypothetical protein Q4G68_11325 [Planctomycetia bacterium]|nr:hypothetical protein [Planctomycetia bacterium]
MLNNPLDRYILMDKSLSGTLTEAEAEELLELLRKSESARREFLLNSRCDFLLREKYDLLREVEQAEKGEMPAEATRSEELEALRPGVPLPVIQSATSAVISAGEWDELARLQRHEKPFAVNSEHWSTVVTLLESNRRIPLRMTSDPVASPNYFTAGACLWRWCRWPMRREWKESTFPVFTALGVLMVLAIVVGIGVQRYWNRRVSTPFDGLARIQESIDVVWSSEQESFARGQILESEKLSIKEGLLALEFASGTRVLLEGPGDVILHDPGKMFCSRGSMSVTVPRRATGFQVETPFGLVTDLGTQFFLNVSEEHPRLDVVKGKVTLADRTGQSILLTTSFGTRLSENRLHAPQRITETGYVNEEKFEEKVVEYSRSKRSERDAELAKRIGKEGIIALFDMENCDKGREIPNLVKETDAIAPYIIRSSSSFSEGPYFGTTALAFGDRKTSASLQLKRKYKSLRLETSLRVDRLENEGNVILASNDFYRTSGTFVWQFLKDGRLQIILQQADNKTDTFVTPTSLLRKKFGAWNTYSVVFDGDKRQITFLVNGMVAAILPWRNPIPLDPGTCLLGDIKTGTDSRNQRFLTGAMDWFAVYEN